MSPRKQYAYRLHVVYPEGIGWQNPPEAWEEPQGNDPDSDYGFYWPAAHRTYLSRSGAGQRAALLTKYGCTVSIERSEPIVWTSGGDA